MQFARPTSIRLRAGNRLPCPPVEPTRATARARRQDPYPDPPPVLAQTLEPQAEAPDRIRYAAELLGAGIMMAGFLALAILG